MDTGLLLNINKAIKYTEMVRNKCHWLTIGSNGTCNKSIKCNQDYCHIHNARLKVSPGTKPCIKCGKGTKNKYMICSGCGYQSLYIKDWRAAKKNCVE